MLYRLSELGIPSEFADTHLDTLVKVESVLYPDSSEVSANEYVDGCFRIIREWHNERIGNRRPVYADVRNDYFDTDADAWRIDVFRTEDDEEGVCALAVRTDGKIIIMDSDVFPTAIRDLTVVLAIERAFEKIELSKGVSK